MAGGAKLSGEGVVERGKGVGARGMGEGGGAMMGVGRGVGRGFNRSFEQNRYRYFRLGCWNARSDTKSEQNRGEYPDFRGIPVVMTSRSRQNVIISPKKVQK